MNQLEISRIGKLIAAGTDPSIIADSYGISVDVIRNSEDIRQSVADAVLEQKEMDVDTDISMKELQAAAVNELKLQINSCTPGELSGVIGTLAKVRALEKKEGLDAPQRGDTVNIQINQVTSPRLQLSQNREIIAINDKSIVPATGEQLDDIIKGTPTSRAEAVEIG